MKDRIPRYPGRVTLTPVAGQANTYDLVRADHPEQEGTPLNKATLLSDATAAEIWPNSADRPADPTVDDALGKIATNVLSVDEVRQICGWSVDGVPKGYTLLDYIESSGTQHILVGVPIASTLKIVAVVSDWPTTETSTYLWGYRSGDRRYELFVPADGGAYRGYYGTGMVDVSGVSCEGKTTIIRDGPSLTVGDVTATNGNTLSGTSNVSMCIFGTIVDGTVASRASLRLYSFQIFRSGELLLDCVPCIHSDGEYGLLDKVHGQFYYNSGSGSFTGG